jgi:hypothetical protein
MTNPATSRLRLIAYWITTALVVFELVMGGTWDILRIPQVSDLIARLGYPQYFLVILGVWKILGAIALAIPRFPRLKEWAYAGVIFDLTGAVASLSAAGLFTAATAAYPTLMIAVAIASWALRPPSRRQEQFAGYKAEMDQASGKSHTTEVTKYKNKDQQ